MDTTAELLLHLIDALEELDIPYALAGSIGATAYGEPRSTRDIDVVVALLPEHVAGLSARFPEDEFHFDPIAAKTAIENRRSFNIIHPASGLKIDLFVVSDAIERHQIADRRRLPALGDRHASFSPPEDLILKKLEYHASGGSEKHLRDIAAMLDISGDEMDIDRIEQEAEARGFAETWHIVRGDDGAD